jgi:hypothetical protein
MKLIKYFTPLLLLICVAIGCKKDQSFNDTSIAASAASASNLSVMFNITHDNSGIVTITPNATGAVSYDVYFGDTDPTPSHLSAGASVQHTYAEGNYQVKLVAHDLKGGSVTLTQPLVVSFLTPLDLAIKVTVANLTASVSATAEYATLFKMTFGDSTATNPVASTFALGSQVVNHTYTAAGTYIITVVALSGGSETSTIKDTINVSTPLSLPITFENPNVNYAFGDFAGEATSLVVDPANSSNHVAKSIKTAGAATYAGVTLGGASGFSPVIPITTANEKMTVMVYSPKVGSDVKLKLDNHSNPNNGLSVETDVLTTVANQWQTLTFDFSKNASGTPAFNPNNVYDDATIFFDFGNNGDGSTYYFDNMQMYVAPVLNQINLPVTFDDPNTDYTMVDFGGNVSTLVVDPTNSSNHVMQSVKTTGAATYAGTTMGPNGFATPIALSPTRLKMTVMVYSPAVGIDVKLKLDNHLNANNGLSVETDQLTTVANQWQTLTFDFSQNASGTPAYNPANTYDLATIFFDFGNAGKGDAYYWDNVILL